VKFLQQAIQQKIGSGLAAAYGNLAMVSDWVEIYCGKTSHLSNADEVDAPTVFDLASLTKILATTSLYMVMNERSIVDLNATVGSYLVEEAKLTPHLNQMTIASLLSHTSGLPAWKPFYEGMRTEFGSILPFISINNRKERFFKKVFQTPLENSPGEKAVYSDLGFLILGYLAEKIAALPFDQLVEREVWSRIEGCGLHFRPVHADALSERYRISMNHESVAATEVCPWRGLLQGQVHDDNAWSMGGVAGHAGVFGTLNDVKTWIDALLTAKIVSFATLIQFTREVQLNDGSGSRRTLGFDLPSLDGSGSTAYAFSSNSVGHLGFTGTSVWLDLDRAKGAILLANRVHPDRHDLRIRNLRREFHTQIG
jgi:CubicO group peptidase (beta-lactamase class C family)